MSERAGSRGLRRLDFDMAAVSFHLLVVAQQRTLLRHPGEAFDFQKIISYAGWLSFRPYGGRFASWCPWYELLPQMRIRRRSGVSAMRRTAVSPPSTEPRYTSRHTVRSPG